MLKKASSIETLIQGSKLLYEIEQKALSLGKKQDRIKQKLECELENYVYIDSINFESKQIYCVRKNQLHHRKVKGRVTAVLAKEVGEDVCQWQIKISGENN